MAKLEHKDIPVGANSAHPPGYVQSGDPGAVGAYKPWVDTTGGTGNWISKIRNAANAAWETIGGVGGGGFSYGFTAPPIASAWTTTNFTGCTLTDVTPAEGDAVVIKAAGGSGANSIRPAYKAAPATPYTLTTAFRATLYADSGTPHFGGILFRESGTSKLVVCSVFTPGNGAPGLRILNYTDPTTYAGNAMAGRYIMSPAAPFLMFRQTDDGANLIFEYSGDMGASWIPLLTVARGTFFTTGPDEIGFFGDAANSAYDCTVALYHWAIT